MAAKIAHVVQSGKNLMNTRACDVTVHAINKDILQLTVFLNPPC